MIGDGDCGEIGGMKFGRENRILGEKLPQRHFVHHKSHMTSPGFEPAPPGVKPATNGLSYGAALTKKLNEIRFHLILLSSE
jgi:hypothetical protein